MRLYVLLILIAASVLAIMMVPVWSQGGQCFRSLDLAAAYLDSQFGETPLGGGESMKGGRTLLFANLDTGTWTAVRVAPSGVSCFADAGERWQQAGPPEPGEGT